MRVLFATIMVVLLAGSGASVETTNVILVTFDGLRWQEVFTGADSSLIRDERYVDDPEKLTADFWAPDPVTRREKLLPFLWTRVAQQGQVYGNRLHGNHVDLTNRFWFSYPGYSELLVGHADEAIDSNEKRPNPNETVLEFINRRPEFHGRVAAFGSWDVFPYIINEERSGVPVNAGFESAGGDGLTDREDFLNELQRQIPSPWGSVRLDAFTHHFARSYLLRRRPRVLYVAYGETDDFAHDRKYDAYLRSARRTDEFIRDLWELVQSTEGYRDRTALVIATDHGRGNGNAWMSHGRDVPGANQTWLAVIGPSVSARGEVKTRDTIHQNQIARTVAALIGVDYVNPRWQVGDVIEPVVGQAQRRPE